MIGGIKIPFPPTVNLYWRRRGSRYFISQAGRSFRTEVMWLMKGKPKFTGRVKLTIEVHPPDRRRRDLDNLLKGIGDALEHAGVLQDDSQIDHIDIQRKEMVPGGAAYILLESLDIIPKDMA